MILKDFCNTKTIKNKSVNKNIDIMKKIIENQYNLIIIFFKITVKVNFLLFLMLKFFYNF
jgi:hypothetical protein